MLHDLTAVKDEIHRLNRVIPKLRADGEVKLRSEVDYGRNYLSRFKRSKRILIGLRAENEQVAAVKADTEKMSGMN
ncbi:hypothetical protein BUALT_Bualt17G0097900 [Buddleja alternifolia]|uniref:Uncharacterized protein n=1 Tax=Buddleja alternifolia TaxID=168488 RepID=A0AAV6WE06_9LAMI|nr:hypothetical protein BUALT_Bualt17G0097900 [Buddleja alternifolia]